MQNKILRPSIKKLLILVTVIIILLLSLNLVLVIPTINLIGYTSAYSACRDEAMHSKSYFPWAYVKEEQGQSATTVYVSFDDSVIKLSCKAVQTGGMWYVDKNESFEVGLGIACPSSGYPCPQWDYHGVSP